MPNLGPRIFRRSFWRISAVQPKFDAAPLLDEIKKVGGGRTIDSEDLRTGLAIVTKRADTGSPWIIVNNPRSAIGRRQRTAPSSATGTIRLSTSCAPARRRRTISILS
jgi:hypothetical protein